jgi:hypothetical protein
MCGDNSAREGCSSGLASEFSAGGATDCELKRILDFSATSKVINAVAFAGFRRSTMLGGGGRYPLGVH